jgi:Xaa-Pro aminopeptidase
VRNGYLDAFDTDMAGPMGYFTDVSRTFLCGDRVPTAEQRALHSFAREFINGVIPLCRAGVTFSEIAERAPAVPDRYRANRYPFIAHGIGMSDEWPGIYFPDVSATGLGNDDDVLVENMVLCVEALVGEEGGHENVKLEEQLIVRDGEPEVISKASYDWRLV